MNEHTSFLVDLAEKVDRYLSQHSWLCWLARQMVPNIGTLLMTVPLLASPSRAPSAISTSLIPYQGRLADVSGTPINGKEDIEFRIYDVPASGMPLWEEHWTGANSVDVSDGLFSVLLGSIDNTLASSIQGHEELYLGITVGTDSEMEPRVQMGSVPFAMQANTVLDGSITTAKLVDEAVTSAKIADGTVVTADLANAAVTEAQIANGAVTSAKIADGTVATVDLANGAVTEAQITNDAVTSAKIANGVVDSVLAGTIIIWTGGACPSGYTRMSSLDGQFLRGAVAYGGTGGSATHKSYDRSRRKSLTLHIIRWRP